MIATIITRNTTPPMVDPIIIAFSFERTNEDDFVPFFEDSPTTSFLLSLLSSPTPMNIFFTSLLSLIAVIEIILSFVSE